MSLQNLLNLGNKQYQNVIVHDLTVTGTANIPNIDHGNLVLTNGQRLEVEIGAVIEVQDGGVQNFLSGSNLTIDNNANLNIESGASVNLLPGALLKYTGSNAKGSLLVGDNTSYEPVTVGANDRVLLADSSIPAGLKWGGEWVDWVPTWQNFTPGNAVVISKYAKIGQMVMIQMHYELGTTSVMGAIPRFELPFPMSITTAIPIGVTRYQDALTGVFTGLVMSSIGAPPHYGKLVVTTTGGAYAGHVDITSTVPFTWAPPSNDSFDLTVTYLSL